jgi:hypothetical protein
MQVFGQLVLWDGLWSQGPTGQEMWVITALWWGWTAIQIALGVLVGIAMYRGAMDVIRAHRAAIRRETSDVEVGAGAAHRDPGSSRGRGLAAA